GRADMLRQPSDGARPEKGHGGDVVGGGPGLEQVDPAAQEVGEELAPGGVRDDIGGDGAYAPQVGLDGPVRLDDAREQHLTVPADLEAAGGAVVRRGQSEQFGVTGAALQPSGVVDEIEPPVA